jgi:hypothetical protein
MARYDALLSGYSRSPLLDKFANGHIRFTQVHTIYGISAKGVYPHEYHLQIHCSGFLVS